MIPDFQTIMRPLLEVVKDGQEYKVSHLIDPISDIFGLTLEERRELLPSQRDLVIQNRIWWARVYMSKAGLLKSTKRGVFKISARGIEALKSGEQINIIYLKRYPEFVEFYSGNKEKNNKKEKVASARVVRGGTDSIETVEQDPETMIAEATSAINSAVADELMEQVLKMNAYDFEKLVIDILGKMGYNPDEVDRNSFVTKKSGDEGLDGIIKVDKLGFDTIGVQAKLWDTSSTIGRPEIQRFAGALGGAAIKNGVFVTTAKFSKQAYEYSHPSAKIILIDGNMLMRLMIQYNIGVQTKNIYEVKRLDIDYFESFE